MVACVGYNKGAADPMPHLLTTAVRWSRGCNAWTSLPDLPQERQYPATVSMLRGPTMVIGGFVAGQTVSSVLALAAGGSEWYALAPMAQARGTAAAVVLPDGKVLVAGGMSTAQPNSALKTAELYDPASNAWTQLPDMAHNQTQSGVCMLPSGRVALVGGKGADGEQRKGGEAFDPLRQTWQPLPEMTEARVSTGIEPVAGGLVVEGALFDEESERWLAMPHPMGQPRAAQLVSLPVGALQVAVALTAVGC